jgi:hypothetical protein
MAVSSHGIGWLLLYLGTLQYASMDVLAPGSNVNYLKLGPNPVLYIPVDALSPFHQKQLSGIFTVSIHSAACMDTVRVG